MTTQLRIILKRKLKVIYKRTIPLVENETESGLKSWDCLVRTKFYMKFNEACLAIPRRTFGAAQYLALEASGITVVHDHPVDESYDHAEDEKAIEELQLNKWLPKYVHQIDNFMPMKIDLEKYFNSGTTVKIPLVKRAENSESDDDVQIVGIKHPKLLPPSGNLRQTTLDEFYKPRKPQPTTNL